MAGYSYQENLASANKLAYDVTYETQKRFPVANNALQIEKGQLVKLNTDGTVQPAVAADFPIGYVTVKNSIATDHQTSPNHYGFVTIVQFARDEVTGYAKGGALTPGQLVSADGQHVGDTGFGDFIVAASGTYATGYVVVGAASGSQIQVAILNAPVLIP